MLLWTLVMIPPYVLLLVCRQVRLCRSVALFYWRVAIRIVGFDIVVRGTICADRPVLFVSNHASYLDIVVLGSLVPAAFVAKKEVSSWPGIGLLAKLGRTVFVDRLPRKSLHQRDEMVLRLTKESESLVLFPEGTSTDGNRVLPFKSALLSVAEARRDDGRALPVQPLSIAYTRLDGMPMGRGWRPFFAWYGDMELASHLWTVMGLGRLTVEVDFLPPVDLSQFPSRKALADHCHHAVRRALVAANAGLATAASPA
jgi:1-acyl-sn-glycerol-3-phosphate acyltransferase